MQEKARKEVMSALSGKNDDDLEMSDIELPYVSAFIKETIRVFPTVSQSSRVACKDCQFGGYQIPKGTLIGFSKYVLNRDPDAFERPEEFIPERYLEGKISIFLSIYSVT